MDGSNLVFIVVPVVIPLVLAIGVALPFIAGRDAARTLSFARQIDRTRQHPGDVVSPSRAAASGPVYDPQHCGP